MSSTSRVVYLDHAATTPVRPEVIEAMLPFFSAAYGNPSSVHSAASAPREALDRAHAVVADVLGCRPGEIVFTCGGTEADNLAVLGVARALRDRGTHVITSLIEHDAVLRAAGRLEREGFEVTYLPVDGDGLVDLEALERSLREDTILVSIMLANNEIGTIQPIEEISRLVRRRGIALHTDAVQAAGSLPIDVSALGVDLLSISAHKIYGPKGIGALYVRRGIPLQPLIVGGEQERGRRAGTENVPGVVGLAVALLLAERERPTEAPRLAALRDRFIEGVLAAAPSAHLTGHRTKRLPGHASFYFDGVSGEALLVDLDLEGIICSSGSACHAGSTDPSHVLLATGLSPQLAKNAIRLTLGRENTAEDITRAIRVLGHVLPTSAALGIVR